MLKFLTHKLRTHSLNEEQLNHYKADDDRDSGTESDDEAGETDDLESIMGSEAERPSAYTGSASACSPASPYFLDSALPSDSDHNYDHHSSEEELEVINSSSNCSSINVNELLSTSRSGSAMAPEKRKWSQITHDGGNTNCDRVMLTPCLDGPVAAPADQCSSSSDDEVQGLLGAMATPVQFRTSPPLTAHKPGHHSLSPPPKLFHYGRNNSALLQVSPRKRHRHTPRPHNIQRPCLDFEKMQQLKARAVTAWRHSGDHGGELSVFCW